MTQTLAPIAFFCYNRPDHTRRTLEALKANELASESKLFIFSDGPKDSDSAREGVAKVREYIRTVDGFASVEIIERERNYGSARNISRGITQIAEEFGRVIVVEDDILTSPYFLRYMNDALELYKDDEKAGAVSAYLNPMYANKGFPQSFFSRSLDSWGWGTWWRSWKDFESDARILLKKIKEAGLEEKYNYGLKHKTRTVGLKRAAKYFIWDCQWGAALLLHDRYVLKPGKAFSNNIGLDGSGLHCTPRDYLRCNAELAETYTPLEKIPVELNKQAEEIYFQSIEKEDHSVVYRALRRLWRMLTGKYRKYVD